MHNYKYMNTRFRSSRILICGVFSSAIEQRWTLWTSTRNTSFRHLATEPSRWNHFYISFIAAFIWVTVSLRSISSSNLNILASSRSSFISCILYLRYFLSTVLLNWAIYSPFYRCCTDGLSILMYVNICDLRLLYQQVWSTSTCEFVRTLNGHRRGIACLQYRDRLVVSGSSDNTIRLWDIESGTCLRLEARAWPGLARLGFAWLGLIWQLIE